MWLVKFWAQLTKLVDGSVHKLDKSLFVLSKITLPVFWAKVGMVMHSDPA